MSKSYWMAIICCGIIGTLAVVVQQSFSAAQERPAVQRLHSQQVLKEWGTMIRRYAEEHEGKHPEDLKALLKYRRSLEKSERPTFGLRIPGLGIFRYRAPDGDQAIMASQWSHPAVAPGEPWGEKGVMAEKHYPSEFHVLLPDYSVAALSAEAHKQQAAWIYEAAE